MWIFYQYAKKSGYFVNLFYRYVWLKNPAIWLADNILDHIFRTTISQIWDLYRNTANKINFHYRTNSVKIKTPILAHFQYIFPPIFGGNKMFLEIPAQSRTISYGFLAPCENLENAWKDKNDGRTDRRLFYRILPANTGCPNRKVKAQFVKFFYLLLVY